MNYFGELFQSNTLLLSVIGFLLLILAVIYVRLLLTTVEARTAQLLASERAAKIHAVNRQLQQTLRSLHAQVWYLDTEARVVDFNQFAKKFSAIEPLQARGRPMMALLSNWHESQAAHEKNLQVLHTGEALCGVIESYQIGDQIHWVSVDRLPSFDDQDEIDGLMLFIYDITSLKNVEEALRFQKTLLEAQSETSLDGIWVVAPDRQILSHNQRFLELWGLTTDSITTAANGSEKAATAFAEIAEQLQEPDLLYNWLASFDTTPTSKAGDILQLKDGRIVDWYSAPVIGINGHHYGRVWYFRDITEASHTEKALRESETRNRALINSIPDLMFRVRHDGTFIDYQGAPGYTPMMPPEHFLGSKAVDIFGPSTGKNFMKKLQAALVSGEVQIHEYEMPMLNGEMRNWEQRLVASNEDEILVIVRDISVRKRTEETLRNAHAKLEQRVHERTAELRSINAQLHQEVEERKRVEEALRNSEERLGLALSGADLALFDIDLQTGSAVFNKRWIEILGYPVDHTFNTLDTWIESIHPDERCQVKETLERHIDRKTPFFEQEYRVQTYDNGWRWVRCRGKVVSRNQQEQALRFSGTQMDITEYKQLERQLSQAQKMEAVGRLAGGVAHDFNNILTVIMSYSELALLQLKNDNRLYARVKEIRKAAEKATRLTRQLLMFSRGETVTPIEVDMNRLVVDIEAMLERLIGEHIRLNIHLDPTVGAVKADPGQLEQVLLNLAVNGRDAMTDGGTLDVTTRRVEFDGKQPLPHAEMQPGIYVELVVTDSGSGMDAETQKRIFEPFFTTKGFGKGTGLGLSTVFGIVKQHHGYIDVQSEVGIGTTFRILFPALCITNRPAPLFLEMNEEELSGVETILLVEDEERIQQLMSSALRSAGYTVLLAANGAEALTISNRYRGTIDLLVTDVIMPEMSGVKLSHQLMMQRPLTKVLYMSGYTDGELSKHGVILKEHAFIPKPFTPMSLAGIVRRILDDEPVIASNRS